MYDRDEDEININVSINKEKHEILVSHRSVTRTG